MNTDPMTNGQRIEVLLCRGWFGDHTADWVCVAARRRIFVHVTPNGVRQWALNTRKRV
jgi:hypothetical protein